jgi:xanthine dehydrogenase accessory factor
MARDILDVLVEMRGRGQPHAVATVIETTGSSSAKPGSKAVIDAQGRVLAGWVGGGCAESMTCTQALECMKSGGTALLDIDLNSEALGAGMPCGGSMRVYVEPILPRDRLWILGHGRVAECLCELGDMLGLEVVVRDRLAGAERYPAATRLITEDPSYAELTPAAGDFVVIATQHKGDHRSMAKVLESEVGYVALIASVKRARLVLDHLRGEGFSDERLACVHAPAGIDLGARTPEEIALAVMCEIVSIRRGGSGRPMRERLEGDDGTVSTGS